MTGRVERKHAFASTRRAASARVSAVLISAAVLLAGGAAHGQLAPITADPRIDPQTGRQLARYAPDRPFDHVHMRLAIDIPDMSAPRLTAVQDLTLEAVGEPRSSVTLDSNGPKVRSAMLGATPCTFEQSERTLTVTFPRAVNPGERIDLRIEYDLDFGRNRGEGLTWSVARQDREGEFWQSPQIHSQGQSEHNSKWFPCHDSPNERATTEMIVTVADGFDVLSNGRMVEQVSMGDGRTRWHWLQDRAHPYYLVSLVVGKFEVIEMGGPDSARPGLPMPVYLPAELVESTRWQFEETAAMVAHFEDLLDEPYPWDQYAQAVVRDFAAGGMENTSATTLTIDAFDNRTESQIDLIAHELVHQWFGDLITCRSWEHLWLNEGWATYGEALWAEAVGARESPQRAKQAYLRQIRQMVRTQRFVNKAVAPDFTAMASTRYTEADSLFIRPDDVYSKGGIVLHMLRSMLGDDAFFRGVRLYIDRHKDGVVETSDFRRAMEEVSGRSLEQFFDQWVFRPGLPRLAVDYRYEGGSFTVSVEQTQRIDRFNPAYVFDLPVMVRLGENDVRKVIVPVRGRTGEATIEAPSRPVRVTIDPELTVFAANEVRTPLPEMADEGAEPATERAAEPAGVP